MPDGPRIQVAFDAADPHAIQREIDNVAALERQMIDIFESRS